jgi:hypothetical protein
MVQQTTPIKPIQVPKKKNAMLQGGTALRSFIHATDMLEITVEKPKEEIKGREV